MSKTTESIENNPFKQKTRLAIVQQAKEWEKQGNPIQAQTLPAEHWIFERELISACPTAKIDGVECDLSKYHKSKAFLESFVKPSAKLNLEHKKITGFSYLGGGINAPYNFVWFDYCGTPYGGEKWGFSRMEEPADVIRALRDNEENGLVYVTYCMTCRHMTVKEMAQTIWKGLSLEGAIKRKIWSLIGTKGNDVHLVFEAKYLGGSMQKTPMLTLGFQVGKKTLTPFHTDWSIEVKQKRAEIHQAKYGGDFIPPEQLTKLEATISKAKAEWNELSAKLQEIQAKLEQNIVGMEDRALIRSLHQQGFNTAAIHEASTSIPQGSTSFGGTYRTRRYFTRRNVGATVAWLK